jgi:hypothetical protein
MAGLQQLWGTCQPERHQVQLNSGIRRLDSKRAGRVVGAESDWGGVLWGIQWAKKELENIGHLKKFKKKVRLDRLNSILKQKIACFLKRMSVECVL